VRLTLGYPFAVELRQLLDEVVVVQKDRSVRADGQRMVVAFTGIPAFVVVGVGRVSVIVLPFETGSTGRPLRQASVAELGSRRGRRRPTTTVDSRANSYSIRFFVLMFRQSFQVMSTCDIYCATAHSVT
jgi:hypothetical protein